MDSARPITEAVLPLMALLGERQQCHVTPDTIYLQICVWREPGVFMD